MFGILLRISNSPTVPEICCANRPPAFKRAVRCLNLVAGVRFYDSLGRGVFKNNFPIEKSFETSTSLRWGVNVGLMALGLFKQFLIHSC